jgi:hypothetical protein
VEHICFHSVRLLRDPSFGYPEHSNWQRGFWQCSNFTGFTHPTKQTNKQTNWFRLRMRAPVLGSNQLLIGQQVKEQRQSWFLMLCLRSCLLPYSLIICEHCRLMFSFIFQGENPKIGMGLLNGYLWMLSSSDRVIFCAASFFYLRRMFLPRPLQDSITPTPQIPRASDME